MRFVRTGAKSAVLILGAILLLTAIAVGAYFGGKWLWGELTAYIRPGDATERKDLVNTFVLIGAGIVGALTALAALLNAYFTRRNLQHAQANLQQQRELDERHAQDDALQGYYEQIGELLTEHTLTERTEILDPVRLLARAQTLTLLERLGSESKRAKRKKGELILFLYAAGLINKGKKIVVPLLDADLSGANLKGASLNGASFSGADLSRADLSGAYLSGAYLGRADLSRADLSGSHPFAAILEGANLSGSRLNGAELYHADLQHADLSGADLSKADLRIANLSDANLSGAYLSRADLREATVTEEQLSRCESLEGATMPEGKKYEDWLKDREGRGEDG